METACILIVVKTYPHPSTAYQELVCTAGMRKDGTFVRLYPVDFRYRPLHQWYSKYQWIEVEIEKNPKDFRPESYRPNLDSIRIIGEPLSTKKNWADRKQIVLSRPLQTMCSLRAGYEQDRTSLGIIKPKTVLGLDVEVDDLDWSERHQQALLQLNLFNEKKKPLRKIPYQFSYRFLCGEAQCTGHKMCITDWELGELYLKEEERLGSQEKAVESVVYKFHKQICAPDVDTHFFVGTTHPYNSWIVLGTFWPRIEEQQTLDLI